MPDTVSAVEEAYTKCEVEEACRPALNQIGVEVELASAPKLVVEVKGNICERDEEDILLLKMVQSAEER